MLANASIITLSRVSGVSATGDDVYEGVPISGRLRCFVDSVTSTQRFTLGGAISEATQTVYVTLAALATASISLATGDRITIVLDGLSPQIMEILNLTPRLLAGAIAHHELYVKKV